VGALALAGVPVRPSYQGGVATIVGFLFGLLAGAIVLTFLHDGSRGSLLLVTLWHALINIALQLASVVSRPVVATMNVLIALGALAIVAWWIQQRRRRAVPVEVGVQRELAVAIAARSATGVSPPA
jgi:uncharacterized membrane protein YhfC